MVRTQIIIEIEADKVIVPEWRDLLDKIITENTTEMCYHVEVLKK